MLGFTNVSKSFDDKQVLKGVGFSLGKNETVGLIGKNGCGKTTVFKILTGETEPDGGIVRSNKERIGYLPQYPEFGDASIRDFLVSKMSGSPASEEYKIGQALNKTGLSGIDKTKRADKLSEGQKTRLYLASLLIQSPEPTVLLLDEPTNNLDLDGLTWLGKFISRFRGSVLLTSHDRTLLDETVGRILELENGRVKNYGGNYSFYREQKLTQAKAYFERYTDNIEEIGRLKRSIRERKERARRLSKDKRKRDSDKYSIYFHQQKAEKIDRQSRALEKRLNRLEKLGKPEKAMRYDLIFAGKPHSHKFIIGAKNIRKSFNGKTILDKISLVIAGPQRIWLSGSNGSGKTTLLKILSWQLRPDDGIVTRGAGIKIGYFSQETQRLEKRKTGIDELRSTGASDLECYDYAAKLRLEPQDIHKQISQISRGQAAKLEFVKLLIGQNGLIILDEPTNHLDIETREEIEPALKEYKGAIVVVSHDRYFLEKIGIDMGLEIKHGKLVEL